MVNQDLVAKINAIENTYRLMKDFAPVAGEVLLRTQSHVQNIGKDNEQLVKDGEDPSGTYLTVLDGLIQDAFLYRLNLVNPEARINVEEKTELRKLFRGNSAEICTVHLDPLDGTKSYTKGQPEFSTGYAISNSDNNFTHTVVYVPAQHLIYVASPDEHKILCVTVTPNQELGDLVADIKKLQEVNKSLEESIDSLREDMIQKIASLALEVDAEETSPAIKPEKPIYEKRVLSDKGKEALKQMGYEISSMHCAHMRVLEVALGQATAYLYGLTNPHDSMIPYAFAAKCGAVLVDVNGKPISGRDMKLTVEDGIARFERLPSVVYLSAHAVGNGHMEKILAILKKPENLNQEYWGKPKP